MARLRARSRRSWLVLAAVLLVALATAQAASAHSVLIATEPANDSILETSPDHVLLRFDEGVESALGSIRVFDGDRERVDAEAISQPRFNEVTVELESDLPRGTYTVAWRVISADSDPINGAFVFHVEAPGSQPSGVAAQVLEDTPVLVSAVYTAGRFFDFALLLLCAGGVASLVLALGSARRELRHRLYGLLGVLAAALAGVALIGLPLQGAAASGFSLVDAFSWDVISAVADTRYGEASLIRAALAATLALVALALRSSEGRGELPLTGLAIVLVAGMIVTPSASGHASVSGPLSFVADIAHIQAAAVWTGGLAFLILGLACAGGDRWPLATRCVPRFSIMAMVSVGVLIIAGTINGYLQVRTWSALWETKYGLLLLGKIGLLLPLLALGAYNNRFAVPRLKAGLASLPERRRFLQAAGLELTLMVAVVGVTAVLVNAPPAKSEVEMHGPATAEVMVGDLEAHITVDPAMAGPNEIHLTFTGQGGEPPELAEVRVSATLASVGIGPLRYKAKEAAHGEWAVPNARLTIPGDWQLRIEARRGEFELLTETISVSIEEES
jgi:copper transport protein